MSFSLSYLPLLIRLKCLESTQLPPYLGSTLHGILGWTLKPHKNVYQYLYENRKLKEKKYDIVNPYVIDPPREGGKYSRGEILSFQLILIGDGIDCAKEVVHALVEAGIFQVGAQRKKFELLDILHGKNFAPVWKLGKVDVKSIIPVKINAESPTGITHCSVQLLTPLRIRHSGELATEIDFPMIIRNISRRMEELIVRYGGQIDLEKKENIILLSEKVKTTSSGVSVKELERFSNRRNKKMDLSGMLGALTFEGEMTEFIPWLNAARILHIGRNVTFGCGKIEVVFW